MLKYLVFLHCLLICLSNVLVQFPLTLLGFHSTWGAFLYPLIFIITDLTVRLYGSRSARRVVFKAMLPALGISYVCAAMINSHSFKWEGLTASLTSINWLALRIALASFSAYCLGQLLDILVFSRLRQDKRWWLAPMGSSLIGNAFDTLVFFFIAFYHCSVPALANNWLEIAMVDLFFKCVIAIICFVPLYGAILNSLMGLNTPLKQV